MSRWEWWSKLTSEEKARWLEVIGGATGGIAVLVAAIIGFAQLRATNAQLQLQTRTSDESRRLELAGQTYDRYADALGRFTSSDPAQRIAGTLELYSLVANPDSLISPSDSAFSLLRNDRSREAVRQAFLISLREQPPSAEETDASIRRMVVDLLIKLHRGSPDSLRSLDLRSVHLSGVSLDALNLQGADLDGANLTGATFRGAILRRARLTRATIDSVVFDNALSATDLDLSGSRGRATSFRFLQLNRVHFDHACLEHPDFTGAIIVASTFTEAVIRGGRFANNVRATNFASTLVDQVSIPAGVFEGNYGMSVFVREADQRAVMKLGNSILLNVVSPAKMADRARDACTR